jgi:hypothetical protein
MPYTQHMASPTNHISFLLLLQHITIDLVILNNTFILLQFGKSAVQSESYGAKSKVVAENIFLPFSTARGHCIPWLMTPSFILNSEIFTFPSPFN